MNRRFELTETGADAHALRSEDQGGILFDLGLGLLQVDAFVRASFAFLRAATTSTFSTTFLPFVGTRMFCPDSLHMAGRIPQRSHYRAIECRAPTPHPIRDGQGGSRPFDANSHFAFQVMLERYGDAERAALKKRLISAVLAGDEPFAIEPNGDRFRRATARVTLRQLQASGAKSATLAAWLAAYHRAERVEGSCV